MDPNDRPTVWRSPLRRLQGPLYLSCLLLVLIPLVDLVSNVWPLRPWEVGWRYGAVGLASGFILTPFLGWVAGLALARTLLQPRALLLFSWGSVGVAILLGGATAVFILDALQVGEGVPDMGRSTFQIGAVRAAVKLALVGGALGWLGLAGLHSLRPRDA